jgi:predicted transcriptional regulator
MGQNGYNQADLAGMLGISQKSVSQYFKGGGLKDENLSRLIGLVWKRENIIASRLRAVADVIDSPFTTQAEKQETLESLIATLGPLARQGEK